MIAMTMIWFHRLLLLISSCDVKSATWTKAKKKKKEQIKPRRAARPIMHVARGAVERPARMQASRWMQLLLHTRVM